MDYRKLELSFHEKAGFRAAVISTGMMIGWAFYDSVIAGLAAGIALMMTENMYKKGLLEKRKDVYKRQDIYRSALFQQGGL